jgi:hypothetical protein
MINLFHDGAEYAIWTDCDQSAHTGRCLAFADTFDEAKAEAIKELRAELAAVEALTEASAEPEA